MNFKNAFKKDVVKEAETVVNEKINLVGDSARVCLNLPQFKAYKDKYIKAESKVIDTMLLLTDAYMRGEVNIELYATKTLVYMTKLKDLRMLIKTVTVDSKKGKNNE